MRGGGCRGVQGGGCGEGGAGRGVRGGGCGEGGVASTKHEVQAQLLTCSRPDSQTLTWSKLRKVRNKEMKEKGKNDMTWQMACHALTTELLSHSATQWPSSSKGRAAREPAKVDTKLACLMGRVRRARSARFSY